MAVTLEQCELLCVKLGRTGAFVEMSYRLFPEIRGSFTPNFSELGFDFQEIRQITHNTELRFQIFPNDMVAPLKKQLEELRNVLRGFDEGRFSYTGHPFLNHDNIRHFKLLAKTTRKEIHQKLKRRMLDNYQLFREEAFDELKATFEALLPGLGISNSAEVLADPSWFDGVFPPLSALRGEVRLDVNLHNVHPVVLMEDPRLCQQVTTYLEAPRQLSLFRR